MNPILHIYKKEVREMFRDKRVRSGALMMPGVLVVLIFGLIGGLVSTLKDVKKQTIHVVNLESAFAAPLKETEAKLIPVKTIEEGEALIKQGKATLVVSIPGLPQEGKPQVKIGAYFDPKEEKSSVALAFVAEQFAKASAVRLLETLRQSNIPPEAATPYLLEQHEVTVGSEKSAAAFLVQLLPYLIVIWAFYGGMAIVSDLVTGEKEKLTLETLLIAPVARHQIALGKFLALSTVSLAACSSAVVGVVLLSMLKIDAMKALFGEQGLGVGPVEIAAILLTLLPLIFCLAGVMIAICAYAKNMREAQSHLASVSFIVLTPAMVAQFIGYTEFGKSIYVYTVPVLNTAAAIRSALQGKIEYSGVGISMAVNGILALIALLIVTRMFRRESILVRT